VPVEKPVAIVYALTGEAFEAAPGQPRQTIDRFALLPAGAVLEVSPGAHLALAFASGKRWAIGGGARVTLGTVDLQSRTGDVRRLPAVPPLPRLAPIRADDHPGLSGGAVRIRGERIKGLYPGRGAAALAGATFLRFEPAESTERYKIEVQDRQGAEVFATVTAATKVRVPTSRLRPGGAYHWAVRTLDRPGAIARGEADFTALDRVSERRREALRRAVAGHRELTALLAVIDRQLGLLAEARDELKSALKEEPENPALAAALAGVERSLTEAADAGPNLEPAVPDGVPEMRRRPLAPSSRPPVND
jgi:hypothetical protein